MRGDNNFNVLGNSIRKPEILYTVHGKKYVNLAVAVNYRVQNAGERKEKARFIPVVAFENLAEIAAKSLDLGSGVYVEGEITPCSGEFEDGKKRTGIKLTARRVIFWNDAGKEQAEIETDGELPAMDENAAAADIPV